jgi:hypothetical protein
VAEETPGGPPVEEPSEQPTQDVTMGPVTVAPRKGRRRLVKVLLVLASILAFVSIFSVWVERQALDTNEWVSTSGHFLEDDTIRTAVGNYLVDQLYQHVNVKKQIGNILPGDIKKFAGPASAGLRQVAGSAADKILQTSTAQSLWETANRDAHEQLLAVLNGGGETVTTQNGDVTLNLGSLVNNLLSQVSFGPSISLPADAGQITILHSDQLGTAQDIATAVRGLAIVFILLTLATITLAIYLSRGERWITVLYSGVALVAAGFAVIVARHVAGGIVVNQLVKDPSVKDAANNAWDISTTLMTSIATSVIIAGFLFIVAGWLASPTKIAWRVRKAAAPVLQQQTGWVYGALGLVLGVYFLSAPSQGLRQFLTTLAIGGMAAYGIDGMRRQTAREFPSAKDSDVFTRAKERLEKGAKSLGETAKSAGETARQKALTQREPRDGAAGGQSSEAPTAAMPVNSAPARTSQDAKLDALERLAALHEKGVLTDEEMAAEKAKVLAGES